MTVTVTAGNGVSPDATAGYDLTVDPAPAAPRILTKAVPAAAVGAP